MPYPVGYRQKKLEQRAAEIERKEKLLSEVSWCVNKNCCNLESFGEICVDCGLCQKEVGEMKANELFSTLEARKVFSKFELLT